MLRNISHTFAAYFNSNRNVSAPVVVVYHFTVMCFTGCTGRGIDHSLLTYRRQRSVYCVSSLSVTARVLMTSTHRHHFHHDRKQMQTCLTNMKTCLVWSLVYTLCFTMPMDDSLATYLQLQVCFTYEKPSLCLWEFWFSYLCVMILSKIVIFGWKLPC